MTNRRSCLSIILVFLLIHRVSPQMVEAVVGDTVILPCSINNKALTELVTIYWRYGDDRTVYDVIKSEALFDEQEATFRGRVESFQDEWRNGNFSIRLNRVKKSDEGLYTCFIPGINYKHKLQLAVADAVHPEARQNDGTSNGEVQRPHVLLFFTFLLMCSALYV